MSTAWKKQLHHKLLQQYGQTEGAKLSDKYNKAFSAIYIDEYTVDMAVDDIHHIEKLSSQNPLKINLYSISESNQENNGLYLRLFQWEKPITLSDILPILENFDLRTESERPYKVKLTSNKIIWISDFCVTYGQIDVTKNTIDVVNTICKDTRKELFQEAFSKVYFSISENDGFNKLVLGASLSSHDIIILRAFAKYLLQIGFQCNQTCIENTVVKNTSVTKNLIALFKCLHDPSIAKISLKKKIKKTSNSKVIEQQILQQLEAVETLDEDLVIRRLLALIKAILRTNFFKRECIGEHLDYLAIKFNSRAIPQLPLPTPLYEIFVYSSHFEAIHLRKDKIARGGIRWSERPDDFRTEILGLMKAQVVKNAVIVPSGAKGGFVLKTCPPLASCENTKDFVVQCYQLFIRALLDLTDNICEGKVIQPSNIVCYDEEDPYLVVAADKGTATFSDLANSIAKEYNFWLGDAFASGGSEGYDHKKIGITARGTWESIKQHFRELEFDITTQDISVIGIGDMSGDVFGNGMIYSNRIKLVGAFDHRHIFIDPNPNPPLSYKERERLFNLPTSSWADYDEKLISKGGGIFKRSLKSISLTPEMKQMLCLDNDINTLTPNELICALLKAPIDLLYNGGIGTYVKASQESSMDVGDRSNDYCRVNGNELRCKVVGEGGNLGFTQRGRVEYALNNGLINTDFIDNSAGVDCSDHEVNLKILLDSEVSKGQLTHKKRNKLLVFLTNEVAELVLNDNYNQALAMNLSAFSAKKNIDLHSDYIKELEVLGILNRQVEFLPNDKELLERKAAVLGLTRPELATLFTYTKIYIKQEILKSNLLEDPYLHQSIETAFPTSLKKKYKTAIEQHPLKKNIIATQISNDLVNNMGITFVYRIQTETGASIEEVIRAYTIASHSFDTDELLKTIETLDFKILMSEQFEIIYNIRILIGLSTRWFLHKNRYKGDIKKLIKHYSTNIKLIESLIPTLISGAAEQYMETLTEKFVQANLAVGIAERIATYRAIYTSLNIVEVATKNNTDLIQTAKIYFLGGERMNLVWFRDKIVHDTREDHWNVLTRLTLRDELDSLQQTLTIAILAEEKKGQEHEEAQELIDKWVSKNQQIVTRWEKFLSMLHSYTTIDYTMFFIAIHELKELLAVRASQVH